MAEDMGQPGAGGNALFDLSFQRFITLGVVKWLYVLLLVLAGLFWLMGVITCFSMGVGMGLLGLIGVSLMVVIQVILWRVMLELIVVIFRIAENTRLLVEMKGGAGSGSAGTAVESLTG